MDTPTGYQAQPIPDPTILTTEQLLREVENVKQFLLEVIERNHAFALATSQGHSDINQEKLVSVDKQFALVERQRVEQKTDTATAVQAALAAAKEAVSEQTAASEKSINKSENAVAAQLGQLTVTFDTAIKGLTAIVDDLKERISRIESRKEGGLEAQNRHDVTMGQVLAMSAGGISLLSLIIYAVTHIH